MTGKPTVETLGIDTEAQYTNGSGRPIRDSDGNGRAVLLYDGTSKRLEFTRGGWSNHVKKLRLNMIQVQKCKKATSRTRCL